MANYRKKNRGTASLIFIWLLILILAIGTFQVINAYNSNHTSLIDNHELAQSVANVFNKKVGDLVAEDFDNIEKIQLVELDNIAYASVYAKGYSEAYDAYNAAGITDAEKANLVDPMTLTASLEMTSNEMVEYLPMFKNIDGLFFTNYGGEVKDIDIISVVAENFKNIEELALYGYTANDFEKIAQLENLTSLSVAGTPLSDITAIESLKNLEVLDLSDTGISDISALSGLDNEKIEMVYLTGNPIEDWTPVQHLDAEKVIKEEPNAETETTESDISENSEKADA